MSGEQLYLRWRDTCCVCGGSFTDCPVCGGSGVDTYLRTPTTADHVADLVALPPAERVARLVALLRACPDEAVEARGTCAWAADDEGTWQSACGAAFTFDDGGPVENGQRYCHSCGSRVVVERAP